MPGESFEQLIHHLLSLRHPDFVPVRTHGNLGDLGADGLLLWDRVLWACYSPQTEDIARVKRKFTSDWRRPSSNGRKPSTRSASRSTTSRACTRS